MGVKETEGENAPATLRPKPRAFEAPPSLAPRIYEASDMPRGRAAAEGASRRPFPPLPALASEFRPPPAPPSLSVFERTPVGRFCE